MTRWIGAWVVVAVMGATSAFAQESNPGPGRLEVTVIPGGWTYFTSEGDLPEFDDFTVGGTVTYNVNRIIGIEGEVGGNIGMSQSLNFGGLTADRKTPNRLNYTGNVVISVPTRSSLVPYATAGAGGVSVFERAELGIDETETYFTGNAGGGLKWYAANGRWGLRGDYRFSVLQGKDDGPAFFGSDTRYSHRVYGGIIITALR
jgi:Outer membrane protein beta-barrel domain